jgi:hypothetical protein
MKVLFVMCEGPHDAYFVGRLLKESGHYSEFRTILQEYPSPLGDFIITKFRTRNVEEIRIGKPDNPLVPVCGFKNDNSNILVLPISLGGMDKIAETKKFLNEIMSSFAPDILQRNESKVVAVSILFTYDADARGVAETVALWNTRYATHLSEGNFITFAEWHNLNGFRLGLFVFSGTDGNTGTLEDNLLDLFRCKDAGLLADAQKYLEPKFEHMSSGGDQLAHETKLKKGVLTTCGQVEKGNAGYALTVVVRDTKLLDGAFDFNDQNAQWTKLFNMISGAFS